MGLALLAAFIVFSLRYDDLLITLTLAGVGFVGGITQWIYLRKFGVARSSKR
jgi:hypothetical protein